MSPRTVPRPAGLVRAGVVAVAVLASSALGLPSAVAAPATVIPLTPPEVWVMAYAVENTGPLAADMAQEEPVVTAQVPVEWTGSIVVQLPPLLDGAAMDVSLDLMATEDGAVTRTYGTTLTAPNALVVTDLGGGKYGVALPADDTLNGPFGLLSFAGLSSTETGIDVMAPLDYSVEFTGTGVSVANVAPQILAIAQVPCPLTSATRCPAIPVDAGEQFGITVPPSSLLRTLGLGTLDDMALGLDALDADGMATGAETIVLTDDPTLVTLADPYNATVTLPASTPGGTYGLTLVQATGTAGSVSVTFGELQVTGVPAPAPRVVNAGLSSHTGWGEDARPAADPGLSPLVAVGAGLMLAAGVGAGAALRRRPAKG
jgi:hypothetical protein